MIPHYLSLVVLGQIDRVLIGHYCGKDKSGIYGLAFQVSMLMNVIIGGINGSLVPWIYEKFKIKDFYGVKKESNRLVFLIGLLTAMAMLVTPELIKIIGTPEYYDAIWIIPAVSLSVFFTVSVIFLIKVQWMMTIMMIIIFVILIMVMIIIVEIISFRFPS